MTPAARVQAAIDLVDAIEDAIAHRGPAADVQIQRYFRSRRYAGSKDRAWIIEAVYAVVRERAGLQWRLESAGAPVNPRSLVLAHLALDDDLEVLLAAPGDHGPAPLDETEQAWLARLDHHDAVRDTAARLGVPNWLLPMIERRFGDALESQMAALKGRAPLDVRVNANRGGTLEQVIDQLAKDDMAAQPVGRIPHALRLMDGGRTLSQHALYRDGLIEVQDTASQIAVALTGASAGERVVDLCAGAGGKTLALSAAMDNRGQIFAFDVDRRKLEELQKRAKRANVRNLQVNRLTTGEKRDDQLFPHIGTADLVVVDAPCGGSGTWRRNPELRWRLDSEELSHLTVLQDVLLDEAAALAKPHGRIAYFTCSLLPAENEERIDAFLSQHRDWSLVDLRQRLAGLMPENSDTPALMDGTIQLTPASSGTDGFFIALLERRRED